VPLRENEQQTLVVGPAGNGEMAAPRDSAPAGRTMRPWAYVLGGVGVAGVVVGSISGVGTLSTWSQAKRDCGSGCAPGSPGQVESGQAHTDAVISTVGFAAGILALGAGAYLFFSSSHDGHDRQKSAGIIVAPWVAAGSGGATLGGTWQ
jgi:hypothetical protein